ncbi:hypothetical protein HN51_037848 [Arachis hypogaea]
MCLTSEALHDVDEEHRRDLLLTYSERLAIAFGIISTLLAEKSFPGIIADFTILRMDLVHVEIIGNINVATMIDNHVHCDLASNKGRELLDQQNHNGVVESVN